MVFFILIDINILFNYYVVILSNSRIGSSDTTSDASYRGSVWLTGCISLCRNVITLTYVLVISWWSRLCRTVNR